MSELLRVEREGPIASVVLNWPEKLNALSFANMATGGPLSTE